MFQITMFDEVGQFPIAAGQLIMANLTWEDTLKHLERSQDANIDYALASLANNGTYSFHNENGKLCSLINHKAM